MNNNQGSSVFDGLLSVDLISVGFVPFPALLIETRSFLPQAARSTGDLVGGGRDIHSTRRCSFACVHVWRKMKMTAVGGGLWSGFSCNSYM